MKNDFFLVTCEHGGNRIPVRYRHFFDSYHPLLRTHRGYDAGALRLARDMAAALSAPLLYSTVSRLLIDLNRSVRHPRLYSEATRPVPATVRQEILQCYYLPYRSQAHAQITQAVAHGKRVIHVSCHSFTPQFNNVVRNADIGLLYDPARPGEYRLSRQWQAALKSDAPTLHVRRNYPYAGTSDGLTTYLRRHFSADWYLGIEIEINQRHVSQSGPHWRDMRSTVIDTLRRIAPHAAYR